MTADQLTNGPRVRGRSDKRKKKNLKKNYKITTHHWSTTPIAPNRPKIKSVNAFKKEKIEPN